MRKHILLRALCGLTFLIFLCPFYQACSDHMLEITLFSNANKEPQLTDSVKIVPTTDTITEQGKIKVIESTDTIYVKEPIPKKLQEEWQKEKKADLKKSKRTFSLNVYDLNIITFTEGFDYMLFPFNLMLLFAALQLIMALCNRYNAVFNLTLFSCIVTVFFGLSLVTFMMQDISQIKYGYYLFLINTIAILVLSKKLTDDAV